MNQNEIKRHFHVDKNASSTLHEQLSEALKAFIATHPPETRIPPERTLAQALEIDRGTVKKVVAEFAKNGALKRNGRRGTFIAGKTPVNTALHPMEMAAYFVENPVKTLRMALYETKPPYKTFWEETILKFNKTHPHVNMIVEWVPDVSFETYPDYLRKSAPDIVQVSLRKSIDYPLLSLPNEFHERLLDSQKFFCSNFCEDCEKAIREIVPVHFSTIVHAFNARLANQLDLNDVAWKLRNKPLELFKRCAKFFSGDIFIGGHVWDYALSTGIPANDDDVAPSFFASRFDELARYRQMKNAFSTRQRYSMESLDRFFRGGSFFNTGHLSLLRRQEGDLPFKMGFCAPRLKPNMSLPCTFSGLAVSAESPFPEESVSFLDYVLSSDVQRRLTNCGSCAFRLSANEGLAKRLNIDENNLRQTINATINVGCKERHISYFLIFSMKDVFDRFFNKEMSPSRAASIAWERWQPYYRS